MDDLQQEFILETRETLELMTAELIAWESQPDHGERLDTIFRFFHTVKGSAGFLALPRFETLAHEAENILALLRDTKKPISPLLVTAILALIDRIAALTNALEQGREIQEQDDSKLIAHLHNAWANLEDAAPVEGQDDIIDEAFDALSQHAGQQNVARTIRISLKLLDNMMNGVSDMVLARNEVARHIREAGSDPALDLAFERLSSSIAELRETVGRTRMQKLDAVFAPLPRIVRDLGQELGKDVALECQGNDVELDREMIEMVRDPLTHIIRNAVDHGIENPQIRLQSGKAVQGKVIINARQSGNHIIISIQDDGKGIDTQRLVNKAIAANICSASDAAAMTEQQRLNLIFETGLSTSDNVSAISGRGVGMDVVRSNIERIGGSIKLQNSYGKGLDITIRVPLTLTIISCLMFGASDQQFAIPQSAIREITMASGDTVSMNQIGDHNFAAIRGQQLPVIDLAHLLGMTTPATKSEDAVLIVIDAGAGFHYILSVDHVMDQEDLVVRAGAPAIMASGIYAGTTLPDHGRPLLLIDPNGLAVHAGVSAIGGDTINNYDKNADDEAGKRNDLPLLIFRDYQQNERAMPLSAIERVEDFAADQIAHTAGRTRLTHDGCAYPLFGLDDISPDGKVKAIRLFDGVSVIYYAIKDIVDMHDVDSDNALQPVGNLLDDNPISSIFIFDGRQIELMDPHWIFSQFDNDGQHHAAAEKPICLLHASDDGWTRQMLAPLIAKAGYEVRYNLNDGEKADICIASDNMSGDADIMPPEAGDVIALRDRPIAADNGNSVYRYDRIGILGALQNSGRYKRIGGAK